MVLDASALLAYFLQERGGDAVATALVQYPCISSLNLSEVAAYFLERQASLEETLAFVRGLPIEVVAFDSALAMAAAALRPRTRHLGLSLGDRACLALAMARNLPVLTADRAWTALDLGIEVRLIR